MAPEEFLSRVDNSGFNMLDRALAVLWWVGRDDPAVGLTAKEICRIIEMLGYPRQNVSRLEGRFSSDRQVSKTHCGGWRLHPVSRAALDSIYTSYRALPPPPQPSDSVLPRDLFSGTRGYLEKIVFQLNASYDGTLYDCCAVMCRRALETLLIEVYEKVGRAQEVKGSDGHFLMFGGLLSHFEQDSTFHPSRNALKGLRDFKSLGDLSAHNRRFNARRDDIDRVRDGLRVAAEELLHLAGLV